MKTFALCSTRGLNREAAKAIKATRQSPPWESAVMLLPSDLELFATIGVTPETLAKAGVRRVTHYEAVDICGIRYRSEHLEGVAFPYVDPRTGSLRTWRVRRDHPEVDSDGRAIAKYVAPPEGRHLYYGPYTTSATLMNVAVDAVIVESEKAVLALNDSGMRTRKNDRLLVALGGCWGWRGVVGKTEDSQGARVDVKGPLSDFDHVAWTGRIAVLLFDSNALTNQQVQAARNQLAHELSHRGAKVFIAQLPTFEGNGPDDFIAACGDEALWSLVAGARRWSKGGAREGKAGGGAPQSLVRAFSQATHLLDLAKKTGAELFHDDGTPYVSVPCRDHHETYKLRSKHARGWLTGLLFDATEKAPGAQAMADAVNALEALALRGAEQRVYVRIAAVDNHVYLDLANDQWQVVEIDPTGWRPIVNPPVRFRRPRGLLSLPLPIGGQNVSTLRPFLNVEKDSDLVLIVAVIVSSLRGRGPFPLLVLNGEHGSSKSTLARVVKTLVDPTAAPLRSIPKEPRDLMIAATHNQVLAFDNLSELPHWLSDALCRLSTGGGFSTRALYSDDDEMIFDAIRPVVLNGIPEFATRQDLVGRSIFVTLPPIAPAMRKPESLFWTEFAKAHPHILGAFLDVVSTGLKYEVTTVLDTLPRMADFARFVVAAERACPWPRGTFMKAYGVNQETAIVATLEGEPVADLLRGVSPPALVLPWSGTASDLLNELNDRAPKSTQLSKDWPKKPRQVADALRRLAPTLRQVGISVTFAKVGRKRSRMIVVRSLEQTGESSSASSASPSARYQTPNYDDLLSVSGQEQRSTSFEADEGNDPASDETDVADEPSPPFSNGTENDDDGERF